MKKVVLILLIPIIACSQSGQFEESFERGLNNIFWKNQLGVLDSTFVTDSLTFDGAYSLKIIHRLDTSKGSHKRNEIVVGSKEKLLLQEEDQWFKFAVFIPNDWIFEDNTGLGEFVSQWHHEEAFRYGGLSPLAIIIDRDHWKVRSVHGDPVSNGLFEKNKVDIDENILIRDVPVEKGVWTVWVIHAFWSASGDGLLEGWINGEPVIEKGGPNCYTDLGLYWKLGIYKPSWNSKKNRTLVTKRELFLDDIVFDRFYSESLFGKLSR